MSGVLGLEPDDFRVLGLALAEFAAGDATSPHNQDDREKAEALLDTLIRWGFVSAGQ